MAMSKGAKGAMFFFVLAGAAMLMGVVSLIYSSSSISKEAGARYEINVARIADLFVEHVKSEKDLKAFTDALNAEAKTSDEFMTNDEPLSVDGKVIETKALVDGSVVGFIDLDNDAKISFFNLPDGKTFSVPIADSEDPKAESQELLKHLNDAKTKEDLPTLSEEVLFFVRAKKKDGEVPAVVVSDRLHNAYEKKLDNEYEKNEYYQNSTAHQRRYYGGYWHPPLFFLYVPGPRYYRSWSSVRASSLGGGRWGSGGHGSGK